MIPDRRSPHLPVEVCPGSHLRIEMGRVLEKLAGGYENATVAVSGER